MALNIATDTAFLLASKSSDRNNVTLKQSMERLTSGLRINSASDDAAGVAVVLILDKCDIDVNDVSVFQHLFI